MGKFDGILICTDLDGTLLRNDGTISQENLSAIEYFKAEGGYFTFVTGRMPYYAMHICETIKPNVPFGCFKCLPRCVGCRGLCDRQQRGACHRAADLRSGDRRDLRVKREFYEKRPALQIWGNKQ